jgi:predicted DCC family thiol-disulfide oxidoreductase YuxK
MAARTCPIVLFDGECNLCDSAVRFIIEHDAGAHFRFASLQSVLGQQLAAEYRVDTSVLDTLVLIDAGRASVRSDAALGIARRLDHPWSWVAVLSLVPRPLRDAAYRFLAENRTRWFGRRDACRTPTSPLQSRFLDF